jgi:hypothetical protein
MSILNTSQEPPFLTACRILLERYPSQIGVESVALSEDSEPSLLVHFEADPIGAHNVDYDIASDSWGSGEFPAEEFGSIAISQRELYPFGEDGFALRLGLEEPAEVWDFLDFYRGARRVLVAPGNEQTWSLSRFIAGVALVVQFGEEIRYLFLSDPKVVRKIPADLEPHIRAHLLRDHNLAVELGLCSWEELCSEWAGLFNELTVSPADDREIAWTNSTPMKNPVDPFFPTSRIVPSHSRVSTLYFNEYMKSAEGRRISHDLFSGLSSISEIPTRFAEQQVTVQTDRLVQTREALELRSARYALKERFDSIQHKPEPRDSLKSTLRLRLRLADALESAYLDETDALVRPLPYFLEKPYRLFRRAHDTREAVSRGVICLGTLVKSIALLAVEELLDSPAFGKGDPRITEIRDAIEGAKPLTDGAWLTLFNRISKDFGDKLPRAGEVITLFSKHSGALRQLIQTRNEWAHSPRALSGGFLREFTDQMTQGFEEVIRSLREAFQGREVVVPAHLRLVDGARMLSAYSIMGGDPDFPMVQRVVEGDLDQFPTDRMVLLTPEGPLPLNRFFRCVHRREEIVDVRVFDRMVNGQKSYFSIDFQDTFEED